MSGFFKIKVKQGGRFIMSYIELREKENIRKFVSDWRNGRKEGRIKVGVSDYLIANGIKFGIPERKQEITLLVAQLLGIS